MRKSYLPNGAAGLIVKVNHYVSKSTFAIALRNHFYHKRTPFPEKLSKREALNILDSELRLWGQHGEIDDERYDSAAQVIWDELNGLYQAANHWIAKNYPTINNK